MTRKVHLQNTHFKVKVESSHISIVCKCAHQSTTTPFYHVRTNITKQELHNESHCGLYFAICRLTICISVFHLPSYLQTFSKGALGTVLNTVPSASLLAEL